MSAIIFSIGFLLLLFGSAVVMMGAIIWIVPSLEQWVPQEWRKALSLQYGIYYVVAGLAMTVLLS